MYDRVEPIVQIHVHPVAAHPLDVPPSNRLVVVRVPQQNPRAPLRHLGAFGERSSSSFFSLPYLLIHLPSTSRPLRRHGAPHRGPESPRCAGHALVPRGRLYSHRRAVQRRRAVSGWRLERCLPQRLGARRRCHFPSEWVAGCFGAFQAAARAFFGCRAVRLISGSAVRSVTSALIN